MFIILFHIKRASLPDILLKWATEAFKANKHSNSIDYTHRVLFPVVSS